MICRHSGEEPMHVLFVLRGAQSSSDSTDCLSLGRIFKEVFSLVTESMPYTNWREGGVGLVFVARLLVDNPRAIVQGDRVFAGGSGQGRRRVAILPRPVESNRRRRRRNVILAPPGGLANAGGLEVCRSLGRAGTLCQCLLAIVPRD